jgi:hypothetical protein
VGRASHDHDFVFEDVHLAEVSLGDLVDPEFVDVLAVNVDTLSLLVKSVEF